MSPKATPELLRLVHPDEFTDEPCCECGDLVKFLLGDVPEDEPVLCDDCEEVERRAALVKAIEKGRHE